MESRGISLNQIHCHPDFFFAPVSSFDCSLPNFSQAMLSGRLFPIYPPLRSSSDSSEMNEHTANSLDHRLEPRFRYMILYGKRKDYSLSTLSCYPDRRFVKSLAFSSLEHYHIWLKSYRHYFDAESLKIGI